MLMVDVNRRYSPQQVLEHSWIRVSTVFSVHMQNETSDKLGAYNFFIRSVLLNTENCKSLAT